MLTTRLVKDRDAGGLGLGGSAWNLCLVLSCIAMVVAFSGCKPDTTPPGNVTGLTATGGDGQVELAWTNPTDSDLAGVKIQRKTGGYPASSTDGTTVFNGAGEAFLDKPLDNGTPYFYGVYAYDKVPNYASGTQATATPTSALARADVLLEYDGIRGVITGTIAPADQPPLLADLGNAETLYRQGDSCGAADLLWGLLLPAVQTARAGGGGTLMGDAEALYNRARMLRYDILSGNPLKDQCPGAERIGLVADTMVNTEDVTQVLAVAALGEPTFLTVETGGEVFTQIQVPGTDGLSNEPGSPAIPVFRRLIAAPPGSQISFEFGPEYGEAVKLNLWPAQQSAVDGAFDDPPFFKNPQAYGTDVYSPQWGGFITALGETRGLPLYLVEVPAGQYNPVTQDLKLFKNVNVTVHFTGGQGFLPADALNGFDNGAVFTAAHVINRSSVFGKLLPGGVRKISGAELLILVPTVFRDAANTLAAWKQTKGITTQINEVGDGTTHVTPDSIRALIKSHYDNDMIRPSYVLLLADSDRIPAYEMAAPIDVGAATIGSDWPYAVMGNPATSTVPDFAVGRIPSKTLFEASVVVDKIVKYEQTPPVSSTFYGRAAIASQFQCCRPGVADGTDQRAFAETSEFARNVLLANGKSVDRIYTETGPATTPTRYYDGTLLPAAIGSGSGFAWSGSTADITAAYNAGRFLLIHRDHGGPDQWVNPFFGLGQIDALTNGDLQPVVFSVNCASGLFDNEQVPGVMGTIAGDYYVAERMLRKGNGGAVGVLGDSRNSPTWANNALLRGYMDAIWPGAIPGFGTATAKHRLGDILNHGKAYMLTQVGIGPAGAMPTGDEATAELRLWHCIGDPTLEIWTDNPHTFTLPTGISASLLASVLTVHYDTAGATITAFQANPNGGIVTLGRGMVKNGQANIDLLNQTLPGVPVQLSVSLENVIPVQLSANLATAG